MKKRFAIILDKAHSETGSPSGGGSASDQPQGKPAAPASTTNPAPVEAQGSEGDFDDFGYPITKPPSQGEPSPAAAQAPAQSQQEKPASETPAPEIKDSSTGYGVDVEVPEAAKPAPPPPEKPASTQELLGYDLDFGAMSKKEADKISSFAKTHALTKEAAQALVNENNSITSAQAENARIESENLKRATLEVKKEWQQELKNDPVFGKENFAHSIHKVDKVINHAFPNLKKILTESGNVLPPAVMKDLRGLHDLLFKQENLVQGDAPAAKVDDSDDPLAFYGN